MYFDVTSLLGVIKNPRRSFIMGTSNLSILLRITIIAYTCHFSGTLQKAVIIPGRLFSVNRITSDLIPNLYARNERLVLIFDTEFGPAAVILVVCINRWQHADIWMDKPYRGSAINDITPQRSNSPGKGCRSRALFARFNGRLFYCRLRNSIGLNQQMMPSNCAAVIR